MNDKKYLDGIEKFKKVTKEDDKLYDNANKYLDDVLKLDRNNAEAKKLKDNIKQNNGAEAKAKVEAKKTITEENTNDPYAWASGIKSKFEDDMIKSGYVDSVNNIRYEKSSIYNNQGYMLFERDSFLSIV
jgi:hypothetical protein